MTKEILASYSSLVALEKKLLRKHKLKFLKKLLKEEGENSISKLGIV